MDDVQRDAPATDQDLRGGDGASRAADAPAAPVARLLANPRRVRRA